MTARAQIVSKVGHVSKILLYAWGERDFNSKPVLFKWTTRFLTMLALNGLTIADVRHFFDIGSPVYQALARSAPDPVSRLELEELADMRPREREELIASTKNRFLGFLQNPITAMVLGKPGESLDVARLIPEHPIIIVNLERGGVLRDEDVEIFANLWLNELLFAAYNMPRDQRVPHFVFLDELPVFQSSADLITRALAQVRKFQVRLVCAFQGSQFFADRTEDRLLNALIGQCNVHFLFRHKNPVDARFFADIIKLPSVDLLKTKHILKTPQQFQDGHERIVLTDKTETWNDAEQQGSSQSDAVNDTDTQSQPLEPNQSGGSQASAHGNVRTDGQSRSTTRSQGGSVTHRTTIVPRIRNRDIISSIQFLTADEQFIGGARDFTRLPVGSAFMYTAGRGVAQVKLPLAKNPLPRTPVFAAKKLSQLRELVLRRREFATPAEFLAERQQFEREIIRYLEQHATDQEEPGLLLCEPEDDNPMLDI